MQLKQFLRVIHRWLGLTSGLVVFIVAITGAIYAFEPEISNMVYSDRKVEKQDLPEISVHQIKEATAPYLNHISAIYYSGDESPITIRERGVSADGERYNKYVYLNPYTAEVVKTQFENSLSFFDIVVQLHINLLLGEVGAQIIKYATLIFLILLITGIYLWWPKKKKARRQRFTFDWKQTTKWKRKNFDLHAVFGFYVSSIVIFAVITGLAWSFQWMDKAIYATATGGKPYTTYTEIYSKSDSTLQQVASIEDQVLQTAIQNFGQSYHSKRFYFPTDATGAFRIYISPEANVYYKDVSYHFDQRTGELLKKETPKSKNNGEFIRDMYYDIHVGQVLGLPGRLLMFFACLIVASLPITGFMIWWGRRKKDPKESTPKTKPNNTKVSLSARQLPAKTQVKVAIHSEAK